jgi:TolA-binding protein
VAHSAKYGPVTLNNNGFVFGFTMTKVTNSYLQGLEQRFNELQQSNAQLNQQFNELQQSNAQLNQSYWDLERNFTALQGSVNELDNTRTVAAVLGITTVCFVATTVYLVLRKPREY